MSARITPRPRAGDTHAGALDAALADRAHLVTRVVLEVKRAPDTWRLFQDLDVQNPENDPTGPDEIRDDVLSYIRNEQDAGGAGKFRVSLFGRDAKGGETRLALVEAGLEPPATADQRATAETNALVETNAMLRRLVDDEHRQKMDMFKVAIEIPKTTVEVLKAMPEALGKSDAHYAHLSKALAYHFMDRDEERQAKVKIEDNKARFESLEKALAKLEPLGMMWLAKIMADAGIQMPGTEAANGGASSGAAGVTVTQVQSEKAKTIKAFCKSLTTDEKTKLILAFDDDGDALAVLFGAAEALTDQACDACLRKLKELLAGKDAMWLVMTIRGIVGDRVVPLVPIMKPIWEEKPT